MYDSGNSGSTCSGWKIPFMLKRTPRKTPISLTPKHPKLRLSLCCLDNKFFASLRIRCHRIPEPFLASSFSGKRGVDVMEKGAWLVEKHPLGGARTLEEFERCHWTRRSWWKMMVVFVYSIHKMIFRFLGHAAWINDSRYDDRTWYGKCNGICTSHRTTS